jgi:pyruvate dehydrogenase E2 component (dihydrolipoamide acetyltransferase)
MAVEVIVPEVGEVGMEIEFVRWLRAEGDAITSGEPLFEVDTAKTIIEVEAFADGRLADLRVGPGEMVSPHQVVALLLSDGESAPRSSAPAEPPIEGPGKHPLAAPGTASSSEAPAEQASPSPGRATPKARRLAARYGLDLTGITNPGGSLVTEADVQVALAGRDQAADQPAIAATRADRVRQAVASRTLESWRGAPHFWLRLDADVTEGLQRLRPMTLVVAAAVATLRRRPECNVESADGAFVRHPTVDIGVLVDTPSGLLLPSIRGAESLGLSELEAAVAEAVARARAGALVVADAGPRSLTVSNLGMFAVDQFIGILPSPDVLLLSVGRARTAPRWSTDGWQPRQIAELTRAVDHRALDGADGGRFLTTLEQILADPGVLG